MPLPMPDQPVIVLLTVNEHETHAVLDAFLDGDQEAGLQTKGGLSYLDLGLHGGNRIIHSSCEMGTGSVGAAQQRTWDAIEHWQPSAVIAVGIAFGLDEGKQKIGDVLVAKQIQDYELGRLESDGKLTSRGSKVDCADNLCNRLRQMNLLEARRADDWPKLHFGLVLTGQKLVDNLEGCQRLKELFPEAIGGEMEGSGLYVSAHKGKVDWFVIKAICDWGHDKNHAEKGDWQKLAAKNAARVLKAALSEAGLYADGASHEALASGMAPRTPAVAPTPDDAARIAQARYAIEACFADAQFVAIPGFGAAAGLPPGLLAVFEQTNPQRLTVARQAMEAINDLAEALASALARASTRTCPPTRRCTLRASLINAMQQAILLSANAQKLAAAQGQVGWHGDAAFALDVLRWESVSVVLRPNLADSVEMQTQAGKVSAFKDKNQLHLDDQIELGPGKTTLLTQFRANPEHRETALCKVMWHKLFPCDRPFDANSAGDLDLLRGKLEGMRGRNQGWLVFWESKHGAMPASFVQWLKNDMHLALVTITNKTGVFELAEGVWRDQLETLYQTLAPLDLKKAKK